jgi:hypothetical protein
MWRGVVRFIDENQDAVKMRAESRYIPIAADSFSHGCERIGELLEEEASC